MDTLGVRMFTAMWNFRAGLENFISQLDKWKSEMDMIVVKYQI